MKTIKTLFILLLPIYSFGQFMEMDPSKGSKELLISNDQSVQLKLNTSDWFNGGGMRLFVNNLEQGSVKTGFLLTPGLALSAPGQRNITFSTNSNVRMFINSTGNIGIGTVTPNSNYQLDVNGAFQTINATVNGTLDVNGPVEANRLKLFGISGSGVRSLYVENNGDISAEKRVFHKGIYFSDFTATRDNLILFPSEHFLGLSATSYAMADLDLPDGAEILDFTAVFMDNSISRNVKLELRVAEWTNNNFNSYSIDSQGLANSGLWRTLTRTFGNPLVVNNDDKMYVLKLSCTDNNGAEQTMPIEDFIRFRGVKISYKL